MGRNTETPRSTVMSSPRQRKLRSLATLLGYSLFLLISLREGSVSFYCLDPSLLQVGDAFQEQSARQELNTIGSAPPQDHVFTVSNFLALGSIQKQLQEKIFTIEGEWRQSPALGLKGLLPIAPCSSSLCPVELRPQTRLCSESSRSHSSGESK